MSYTSESQAETLSEWQAAAPRQLPVPQPLPPDLAHLHPPQMRRVVICMPTPDSLNQFAHAPRAADVPGPARVTGDVPYAGLGDRMYLPQRLGCEPATPEDVPGPARVTGDVPYAGLGDRMYLPPRLGCEPATPEDVPGPAQVAGDVPYAYFDNRVYQFPHAPCVPPPFDIADLGRVLDPLTYTRHPSTLYGRSSGLVWLPECDCSGQAGCRHGSREEQVQPATHIMKPECRHFHQYDASLNPLAGLMSLAGAVGHGGREVSRGARATERTVRQGGARILGGGKTIFNWMRSRNKAEKANSTE